MKFKEFLEIQRKEKDYIKAIDLTFKKISLDKNLEPFLEVLDKKKDQQEADRFPLFRHDILAKISGGTYIDVTVNINPTIFKKPESFTIGNIIIIANSFVWNGCRIRPENNSIDFDFITNWYTEEIKPDQKQIDKKIIETIHSIIFSNDDGITIDFGSLQAFKVLDFFNEFSNNRNKSLTLTSAY